MPIELRVLWAVFLPFLLALGACGGAATSVELEIGSSCPENTTSRRVRLVVLDSEGTAAPEQTISVERWPVRWRLTPRGGDASRRWRVRVTLLDGAVELGRAIEINGGYEAGRTVTWPITLMDPMCGDAGVMDAGAMDAGPNDAGSRDAGALDAASDAPSPVDAGLDAPRRDAGTRSSTGLVVAYPFDDGSGATARECVAGHGLDLSTATVSWGEGLTLSAGWARSRTIPATELSGASAGLSVEIWLEIDPGLSLSPSTSASPDQRRLFGLYDTSSFYNPLRVSVGGAFGASPDAGRALDAGAPMPDPRFAEVLGGVTTSSTGDSYARPLRAGRLLRFGRRTELVHVVYTYAGTASTGDEHVYVDGSEVAGSDARWIPAPTMPPRVGRATIAGSSGRVYVGNYPGYADIGGGPIESPPDPSNQFVGTYHLLAIYDRVLGASEVTHHHALGHDASPCP